MDEKTLELYRAIEEMQKQEGSLTDSDVNRYNKLKPNLQNLNNNDVNRYNAPALEDETLKMLQQISETQKGLSLDKAERASEVLKRPYTEPKSAPWNQQLWFQQTQIGPNGLQKGRVPSEKDEAIMTYMREMYGKKDLNVQDLNRYMEQIPEETSDPRKERFKKLFNK